MSMNALTAEEQDLILASRRAMDAYDVAKASGNGASLINARRRLEDIRSQLEAIGAEDPAAIAMDLVRKALQRPIDHLGRPIDRVAKGQRVIDHRQGRGDKFDKLQRPSALAK